MLFPRTWRLLAPLFCAPFALAGAQGLPAYRSVNPALSTRSALGFQPIETGIGWRTESSLSYASIVELRDNPPAFYLLDAEITRLDFTVTRYLDHWFVQVTLPIQSAHAGFLDQAVRWWHGLIQVSEQNRDTRPDNEFEYLVRLPDGSRHQFLPSGTTLGGARAVIGVRHAPGWQTALLLGAPTGTGPEAYRLGTLATGIVTTVRRDAGDRLRFEGSAGIGYTPRHGMLHDWQRTMFLSGSAGARWRFAGRQWVYANFLFHSAPYHGTRLRVLDDEDFSLDLGFLLQAGAGPQILVGLVEDLYVYGPAVDLVLRLGVRW